MYPAVIESYDAPRTVKDALAALAKHGGEAHFIAGGQSLMQAIKSRIVQPKSLIDLQHVAELKGIDFGRDGVRVGAMTRYRDIATDERLDGAYQALRDAAQHVGDRQVRNRGTIGGSLCWNYLAACMPPTNIGIGSKLELLSAKGQRRTIAAEEFLRGPLETARREDEILLAIVLPDPPAHSGSAYKKWGLVTDALPVVGVCAYVELGADGKCKAARLAVGGLASGPKRAKPAEQVLVGKSAGDVKGFGEAADAAASAIATQADMWADSDYRKKLIGTLGREVIATAFARAQGGKQA